jgi:hypothetical protein
VGGEPPVLIAEDSVLDEIDAIMDPVHPFPIETSTAPNVELDRVDGAPL